MKKTLLATAIATTLAITGCDSDSINSSANPSPDTIPKTTVSFDPTKGEVSTPTDFLVSPVTGLLDIPADKQGDIYDSLRSLDGWGVSSPINLDMVFPGRQYGSITLDADSLDADAFILLEQGQTTPLQLGDDYILTAGSDGLVVVPKKPLKPGQKYLFVITDELEDSLGRPVEASQMYQLLADSNTSVDQLTADPVLRGKLSAIQSALTGIETGLSPLVGDDDIIYAGSFTTQTVGQVITEVMTQIETDNPALTSVEDAQAALSLPDSKLSTFLTATGNSDQAIAATQQHDPLIYFGSLALNYYLDTPDATCMTAIAARGSCDALESYWKNSGGVSPRPGNYKPVPQSTQNAQVFISLPDESAGVVKPASGWPVALYVHGITSYKETAVAIAGNLAAQGIALVAIDLPLHGARSLDLLDADQLPGTDGVYDITATDTDGEGPYANGTPLVFANLGALRTVRDNLKQSTNDILTLRRALENVTSPTSLDFDNDKVSLLGVSLGSIIGTSVVGAADMFTAANPTNTNFQFNAAALTVGGSQAAAIMGYSNSFGADVKSALQANDGFSEAVAETLGYTPDQLKGLRDGTNEEKAKFQRLADLAYGSFASGFISGAQQVIDSADSVAWVGKISQATPVLATQVIGNGVNLQDQTVPNSTAEKGFPLGGTSPWVQLLGLTQSSSATTATPVKAYTNFMLGKHTSLLDPAEDSALNLDAPSAAAATAEMQTQVISFIKSEGLALQGSATNNGAPTGQLNTTVVQ